MNWVNAVLTDSDEPFNFDHFAFRFETKNPNDLINFTFSSINEKEELIEFTGTKKITAIKLSNSNFRMIKTIRNGQKNQSLNTQYESIVKDLKKDTFRL